jgi:cytosine/adenosine deaminase-related metal-dependent hydrolase
LYSLDVKRQSKSKTTEVWITNALVATQDDARRVLRTNIQIIDGRIAALTTKKPSASSRASSKKIVDARGLVVLPGFVQTHIHLCQTLFRNQADDLELLDWLAQRIWPMEAAHTEETLNVSALLGIHELLSSGTTCILDMGTVRHTEAVLDAVKQSGIRASVGKCLMDSVEYTPPGLCEKTSAALREATALYEKWNGACNDRIRISYAPRFVVSCTEGLMREVARLSEKQNAVVHTHASENRKEVELVQKIASCENIEYFDRLGLSSDRLVLAHGIWLSAHEMNLLEKHRINITHCPSSNLKLASGIARVPEMRRRGINVSLGADGAPCNNNLSIFQEMRLAALLQKPEHGPRAMRAQEVLDMATRDGAKALHWFDDIGSIEVGKKADLVALDLSAPENLMPEFSAKKLDSDAVASAVVYATQPQHVRWTMVDGKTLYRDGVVQAIATESLLRRAHRAQAKIKSKVL